MGGGETETPTEAPSTQAPTTQAPTTNGGNNNGGNTNNGGNNTGNIPQTGDNGMVAAFAVCAIAAGAFIVLSKKKEA